jgi:deazaflavin-dependent oxidoreductase (nitroreductase family)
MTMPEFDREAWTRDLIADMRSHGGVPSVGPFRGRKLLILRTTGARTGQPRTAILAYRTDGDRLVVAGSKGGAPTNPAWVRNLEVEPAATIEVDNEIVPVRATIEARGPERDRLWAAHVEEMPGFAEYPDKTDRIIPMIVLERVGAMAEDAAAPMELRV